MNWNETLRRPLVRRTALAVCVAVALTLAISGGGEPDRRPSAAPGDTTTTATAAATTQAFFDRYVDGDGRVVRHDQGGDTVSEGQAYAMLVAAGAGDEGRFRSVWDWARRNLQRPDGLLSWHWRDGAVVDAQSAADADVDAARALVAAAERFSQADLRGDAVRIARAVLDHETITAGGRTALAAGPWAVSSGVANPSYFSPCADADLARLTGDPRWHALADDAVALVEGVSDGGHRLPPDWARLDGTGALQPTSAPGTGGGPRYGLDAARVALRFAERCDAEGDADDRAGRLAAALWPTLDRLPADGAGVAYQLDGTAAAAPDARHPVGLLAAAASASAAGDRPASGHLLDQAVRLDRTTPTYYGAAWLALATAMPLGITPTTDTGGEARPVGSLQLIASTGGPGDPTTSATSATSTSTSTTAPTTTSSTTTSSPTTSSTRTSSTTTSTAPTSSTATTTAPERSVPEVGGATGPGRPLPPPLEPGVLTRQPTPPAAQPGTPPVSPADSSTPARTLVLALGAGLSGVLGRGLGRRAL